MSKNIRNNKNPRNAASNLYKRLTKLFSGPLVSYRGQTERQLRRRYLDKYKFQSASGRQFKRASYDPLSKIRSELMVSQERMMRYTDFQQMEYTPELASALDIYADEMTTSSGLSAMYTIDCPNQEIKSILEALYNNILNLEFNLFGWARTMCKFGDFFLYLDIEEGLGVRNVIGLPPGEIERIEGKDETNPNYIQYQWNAGGLTLENWQVGHFRILGNDKYAPYGTSVLDPARRIWRQLTLLEDAMMAYRITRSAERRVFYVDVGNISPEETEQYMQRVMTQMKRNMVIDADSGRVDLRYNPMSIEEDIFIPTRAGINSRVETLAGGSYTGDIDDVKYLRDKMFAAIKIPQSYISRGEGADEDKATLAQKDIRFARTIQRLQRSIITELEKIGTIHLYVLGFKGKDLISHKMSLNNPSKIAELQELEHWRTKFDVASSATEGYFSKRWVARNIFNQTEDNFLRMKRELFYDAKFEALVAKAAEEITAEGADPGPSLGEPEGGALGGLGDINLDTPGEGTEGTETVPPSDEDIKTEPKEDTPDSSLMATPGGKRDEKHYPHKMHPLDAKKSYTTPGAKGKVYTPVTTDKRRGMGSRQKNIKGHYSREKARNTKRNVFPGIEVGIYESKQTNYDEYDEDFFETKNDILDLVRQMEQINNETKT